MKIQMYKAIDSIDEKESMFAISGKNMCVSSYHGEDDMWLSKDKFGDMEDWPISKLNKSRIINPVLIWEHKA